MAELFGFSIGSARPMRRKNIKKHIPKVLTSGRHQYLNGVSSDIFFLKDHGFPQASAFGLYLVAQFCLFLDSQGKISPGIADVCLECFHMVCVWWLRL